MSSPFFTVNPVIARYPSSLIALIIQRNSDASGESSVQVPEIPSTQHSPVYNELDDVTESLSGFHVAKNERSLSTHSCRIPIHYLERGANQRRHINLIDDQ